MKVNNFTIYKINSLYNKDIPAFKRSCIKICVQSLLTSAVLQANAQAAPHLILT